MSIFHHEVTMPAINLASTIRHSTATYRFVFRVFPEQQVRRRATSFATASRLHKTDLEDMDVLEYHVEEGKGLRGGGERREYRGGGARGASSRRADRRHSFEYVNKSFLPICSFKPPQRRGQAGDAESSRGLLGFMFS